ncbi:MAG: serine/threonine protein kinase [Acidimicrobiia bacterium]|nr:serine/threonine protein kinase [Acidimicrobiia bacterium]
MSSFTPGRAARPEPEWLITADFEDFDLGPLTTGKEAEVFLVERRAGQRACWLVHKRYRPRSVTNKGELEALGFQRSASFANDQIYRDGRRYPKRTRDRRAVERMTRYGKQLVNERWAGHELEIMQTAWRAGADVPYPVGDTIDGMLMEYIGDARAAAPTLARARLGRAELDSAFVQIVDNLHRLLDVGIVHADPSPFNVLWWEGRVWLIDFPQAVEVAVNPHALGMLHRDVDNLCRYFARRRVDCDTDKVYADLLDHWSPR